MGSGEPGTSTSGGAVAHSSMTEPSENPEWPGTTADVGEMMVDRSVTRNAFVKFMMLKMQEVGLWTVLHWRCMGRQDTMDMDASCSFYPGAAGPHPERPLMLQAGCAVERDFIKVEHCDAQVGGGFRPPDGVVVCHNHLASQTEVCAL